MKEKQTGAGRATRRPKPTQKDRIELRAVLHESVKELARHVVFGSPHERRVLALFAAHTHPFAGPRAALPHATPRIDVRSPEPACGKTTCAEVMAELVRRPLFGVDMSAPALYRSIAKVRPCVLYDEFDHVLHPRAEKRASLMPIVNAGYRQGGTVLRADPPSFEPQPFDTFTPWLWTRIDDGRMPATLGSRSLPIVLARRLEGENVEPWRARQARPRLTALRKRMAAAMKRLGPTIAKSTPAELGFLSDRQHEISEHLVAIADMAGGEWPDWVREALVHVFEAAPSTQAERYGTTLLRDCRSILNGRDRIPSERLAQELRRLMDSPWPWWGRGDEGVTERDIARLLAPYGIKPGTIRIGSRTAKGYRRAEDFEPAWKRYLAPAEEEETTPRKRRRSKSANKRRESR